MENEVAVVPELKYDLSIARAPKQVLMEAQEAAKALQSVIAQSPTVVKFNGKTYLAFEHWQVLGRFYGVTARVVSTEAIDMDGVKGFLARAEAVNTQTGQIVSAAESMCLNDESTWAKKPLFQLRSMSQTRACAKSLRNVLAWVVVLAGYEPSVAEEMTGDEQPAPAREPIKEPQRKSEGEELVTEFVPTEYDAKNGTSAKTGKPWVKHGVKDATGKWFGSFSEEIGEVMAQAAEQKKKLHLVYIADGKYNNVRKAVMA